MPIFKQKPKKKDDSTEESKLKIGAVNAPNAEEILKKLDKELQEKEEEDESVKCCGAYW